MNRVLTMRLAALHFAPPESSKRNLLVEGIAETAIHVTGNSGTHTILNVGDRLDSGELHSGDWSFLAPAKKLVVVTAVTLRKFREYLPGIANDCGTHR